MGLGTWMRGLLPGHSGASRATAAPARRVAPRGDRPAAPAPALPARWAARQALLPEPSPVGNLDVGAQVTVVLEGPQEELVWRLSRRIDSGRFEVPQLPATALSALELTGRPSAEISAIVNLITTDPLLSSELLQMANSALYAAEMPAGTLQQAVMRVGLRSLRGLIFSASMRGVLFKDNNRDGYSDCRIETQEVKATICEHEEFKAYADRVAGSLAAHNLTPVALNSAYGNLYQRADREASRRIRLRSDRPRNKDNRPRSTPARRGRSWRLPGSRAAHRAWPCR